MLFTNKIILLLIKNYKKKIISFSIITLLCLLSLLLTQANASTPYPYDQVYFGYNEEDNNARSQVCFERKARGFIDGQGLEDKFEIERLSTSSEHLEALEFAFRTAKKSILVTNYGRLYAGILETSIFKDFIPEARARNVSIYIRYNHDDKENGYSPISEEVQAYFDYYGIDVARLPTHAKILAADDQFVVIGSYNWLTDLTSPYEPPINHSFVYYGHGTYAMKEHIWNIIKYYRNKEFGQETLSNYRRAYQFKRNPLNQTLLISNSLSKLTYIALIEAHRSKLLEVFENAKQRLVILSPFVAMNGRETYQRDFVHKLLKRVLDSVNGNRKFPHFGS